MAARQQRECQEDREAPVMKSLADICVLIPAYNPNERLLDLTEKLLEAGFGHIIVVNDGSSGGTTWIFDRLAENDRCDVLTHAVNFGKGRALKTGLNHFLLRFPGAAGVVTADADGQHICEDIIRVADSLLANPGTMVLGARSFDVSAPLRSLLGNMITRFLFRILVGMQVADTQTGLRGIPAAHVPFFLKLDGERYEYEMNMLIESKDAGVGFREVRISTIYIDDNRSSHFNPIVDSMRIYFLLIRFFFSSIVAAAVDFVVFTVSYQFFFKGILACMIMGRVVASIVNFTVNKRFVFHHREKLLSTVVKYYVLTVMIMILAYSMIVTMVNYLGMNVLFSKVLAETVLFMASFTIQRDFIFQAGSRHE
ncbi:MAG: bifunctional glycosyltransferase family 2/GtrA family protein [Thermodesulfovibrionales bacterium]